MSLFNRMVSSINAAPSPDFGDIVTAGTANSVGSTVILFNPTPWEASFLCLGMQGLGGGGVDSSALMNIMVNDVIKVPDFACGYSGPWIYYEIPLYIPISAKVSVNLQCQNASEDVDVGAWLLGGDDNSWAPASYRAYGANEGASRGVSFTAGNGAEGSTQAIGTTTQDHPAFGVAIQGGGDTQMDAKTFAVDELVDGSVKVTDEFLWMDTAEHLLRFPPSAPVAFPTTTGQAIQIRGQSTGSAHRTLDAVAYGQIAQSGPAPSPPVTFRIRHSRTIRPR